MGIKYIQFAPCPECSESERPHICHDVVYTGGGDMEFQTFYAMCRTCGYETKRYNHVIELAEAWNKESNKAWDYIFEAECERLKRRLNDFN